MLRLAHPGTPQGWTHTAAPLCSEALRVARVTALGAGSFPCWAGLRAEAGPQCRPTHLPRGSERVPVLTVMTSCLACSFQHFWWTGFDLSWVEPPRHAAGGSGFGRNRQPPEPPWGRSAHHELGATFRLLRIVLPCIRACKCLSESLLSERRVCTPDCWVTC